MLKKLNKNSGMSLVEVIVSMLVLSIAVVAVTMSFSTASRINMGSRQKQTLESLMENLLEYAEAGGTEYASWFSATSYEPVTEGIDDPATQQKTLYKGVRQGTQLYDVRVLVDTDPDEYANDKLNDYEVIQFGSASSNTILIDASLKSYDVKTEDFGTNVSDYDEDAYQTFFNQHSYAVLEANLGGATPPLTVTPLSQIPHYVDRELRLVVSKPTEDKMKLTAYLYYKLDASILVPTGKDTFETTLYVSDLYDLASDPDEDAKKLDQVYIMYSPAALETVGYGLGQDIRIMDPEHVMNADIFIANQQTSLEAVGLAVGKNEINERDTSTHTVYVSCNNPAGSGGADMKPAGGNIYCSGLLAIQGFDTTITAGYSQRLLAKGEKVRIIATTLEILEAGTNTVLASKTVTHLQ